MTFLGIEIAVENLPELDPAFIPLHKFNEAFLKTARKPVGIAVERSGGEMAACHTFIHGTEEFRAADHYYINRLVKTILWMKGGFRVYVSGDEDTYQYLCRAFGPGGEQEFDWDYMAGVFEQPFDLKYVDRIPESKDSPKAIGGHLEGCRIGFDAGGSDRKVSAVVDGETVYPQAQQRPGLSLRGHCGRSEGRSRPSAPGGRGGRLLGGGVHQRPDHGRRPVSEGAEGPV